MSFDTLPPEIIFDIASLLPKRDIIRFALLTFNKQIFAACEKLLKGILKDKAFENRMKKRFGTFSDPDQNLQWRNIAIEEYIDLGYEEMFGEYVENHNPNGDFLEPYTGDLRWLPPFGGKPVYRQANVYSDEKVTKRLEEQAVKLGVEFPKAFLTFMQDEGLQAQIDNVSGGTYVELGDELRKCIPSMLDGGEGYIIRFYNDQQGCAYWALYLDAGPEKGHCVLNGQADPNYEDNDEEYAEDPDDLEGSYNDTAVNEMKVIMEEGKIKVAWCTKGDWVFESSNFEEWLAKTYFQGCYGYQCDEVGREDLGPVQDEYVRHNFTSEGKAGGTPTDESL